MTNLIRITGRPEPPWNNGRVHHIHRTLANACRCLLVLWSAVGEVETESANAPMLLNWSHRRVKMCRIVYSYCAYNDDLFRMKVC